MKRTQHLAFGLLTLLALIFAGCKDECKDVTCLNGGTCIEGTCECADGYEGADCGVEERAKFLGTYDALESVNGGNQYSYSCELKANSGGLKMIEIHNFFDLDGLGASPTDLIICEIEQYSGQFTQPSSQNSIVQ